MDREMRGYRLLENVSSADRKAPKPERNQAELGSSSPYTQDTCKIYARYKLDGLSRWVKLEAL